MRCSPAAKATAAIPGSCGKDQPPQSEYNADVRLTGDGADADEGIRDTLQEGSLLN